MTGRIWYKLGQSATSDTEFDCDTFVLRSSLLQNDVARVVLLDVSSTLREQSPMSDEDDGMVVRTSQPAPWIPTKSDCWIGRRVRHRKRVV